MMPFRSLSSAAGIKVVLRIPSTGDGSRSEIVGLLAGLITILMISSHGSMSNMSAQNEFRRAQTNKRVDRGDTGKHLGFPRAGKAAGPIS